jgi:5-methylthioadenosine/S-adenosylhomocysteine deaminase
LRCGERNELVLDDEAILDALGSGKSAVSIDHRPREYRNWMTTIYSAKWVVPVSSLPIEDGAVVVEGKRIVGIGNRKSLILEFPEATVDDFGEAAIIPGLVNCHTHLELTAMRGFLEREEGDFFAWLKKLTIARVERMTTDDLSVSATCGAVEAARAGITCVADASDSARQSMAALSSVGLRGIVYQESFGPDPKLVRENLDSLHEKITNLRELENDLVRVGVSPHAPYTVSGIQLEMISQFALGESLPLMIHAAESEAEAMLMRNGTGIFADNLARRGIEWHAPGMSTIQYLQAHGILDTRPLLAHCIQVDQGDIEILREFDARVAHCPKSNAKLGHGRAPLAAFVKEGLKVGIGSDSVASNNTCDMLEEARFAALVSRIGQTENEDRIVSAEDVLYAATIGGARALDLENSIGALAVGMQADFVVIGLDGAHQQPVHDPIAAIIFASSGRDVRMTVVAGEEIYRDGHVRTVDEQFLRVRIIEIAGTMTK